MRICTMCVTFAATISVFVPASDVQAQSSVVTLTLDQSTNGLGSWQTVQVTNIVTTNANAFYRMRIAVSPLVTDFLITVQGGTLPSDSPFAGKSIPTFLIGKYEVTWSQWLEVSSWATSNGYDLAGAGSGSAANHPVGDVNWFDIAKWCNARSQMEGLTPVYKVSGAVYRAGESVPTIDRTASGYRMPSAAEWEWAAQGGNSTQGYIYSGSDNIDAVAWYRDNSQGKTRPVGTKQANELGIHDMSGNVWELCEDIIQVDDGVVSGPQALNRGGAVFMPADVCAVRTGGFTGLTSRISDHGFRIVRNAP